ncbi:MAG: hypothetical protein EXR91_07960 [Gemmatimonadetes bacterium]|nr:hypothetical protein [Gemmatimonadota bacterium]
MIFRRYGIAYHSVELNFDSRALNEIGFRRDQLESIPADDFAAYAKVGTRELVAEAQGSVQDETETALLGRLAEQIVALDRGLSAGELLVVDNEQGNDWPKTRQKTSNVVVELENRLHFQYTMAPALRVTVWRRPG